LSRGGAYEDEGGDDPGQGLQGAGDTTDSDSVAGSDRAGEEEEADEAGAAATNGGPADGMGARALANRAAHTGGDKASSGGGAKSAAEAGGTGEASTAAVADATHGRGLKERAESVLERIKTGTRETLASCGGMIATAVTAALRPSPGGS